MQISLQNIGKQFRSSWIFRGIDHQFQHTGEYVITGPNGSGKSTLMKILSGYSSPTEGSVIYNTGENELQQDRWYQHIAVCSPYMELVEEYTLQEMIDFHFKFKHALPGVEPGKLPKQMLLENATDKPIGAFSSGMMQRLKLGLALFSKADVIFLDEPAMNLDKQGVTWYKNMLEDAAKDRMLIIFTNHPELESSTGNVTLDLTSFK